MYTPFTSFPNPNQELSAAAIALGLPVFPCAADKSPLTAHGHRDASTEPARIWAMFSHPRAALIAIPTGRVSGIVAVDVDRKNGKDGLRWLEAVEARLPPTKVDGTPNGGLHLLFQAPALTVPTSVSRLAPGVDVRGEGGSVIVPPSPGYRVIQSGPLAEMPTWLIQAANAPKARWFGNQPPPPLSYASLLRLNALRRKE